MNLSSIYYNRELLDWEILQVLCIILHSKHFLHVAADTQKIISALQMMQYYSNVTV